MYLRQSRDRDGDAVAIARQREDCEQLCAAKGWTPVEFVDNDISASSGRRRPAYERMLEGIRTGHVGAVVAWDLDRLHRRPIELEEFMALADEKHIALATVSGDVDLSTAQGRLVARLKGAVARHEVDHKSSRQRRASRQKAEKGLPHWSRAFGYLGDTHQLDPHTAPLVREAYAAILTGASLADVCRLFNDAGAFNITGKPWTPTGAAQFLKAPRNCGLRAHTSKGVTTIVGKGTWAPLVDESTWRAVQNVFAAPERRWGQKSVRRHLLSGTVVFCGVCGRHLNAGTTSRKTVNYFCKTFCVSIMGEHLEQLLYGEVEGRLAKPDAIDLLKAELHDQAEAEEIRLELETLYAELDNIGVERAEGLLTGRQAKIATDRISEKIAKLELRQQDQERLRVFDGLPLGEPEVVDAVHRLSPDRFRAVLGVLMTVVVMPVGGTTGRAFDPRRVKIKWKS
jgi:DNA invertase Pin-like site-specific DNA recombinase